MLQYKIPQNVQREDQIIYFLTFRHLGILAAGGAISYFFYITLAPIFFIEIWGPLVFIPSIISLCAAFITINGVSFTKWFFLFLEFTIKPRRRIWNHKSSFSQEIKALITTLPQKTEVKNKKAEELALPKKNKSLAELVQEIDLEKASYRKLPVVSHEHGVDLFEDNDADSLKALEKLVREQKEKGSFGSYIAPQQSVVIAEDLEIQAIESEIEDNAMAIYEETMKKIASVKNLS